MSSTKHQVSFERRGDDWKSNNKNAKEHKMAFEKNSGPHSITFNVGTPTGRYLFDQTDPIWVKIDDGSCPTTACSHEDIEVTECALTQLIIENKNARKAVLRYQLNVYDTTNSEWCPIDPIIDNGGHG